MENTTHKHFSFHYKDIIIDEIALSGLDGVGFDLLWRLVEKRISSPVTEKMKSRFWNFILKCEEIALYQLPEAIPHFEIKDRFSMIDQDTGYILDPPDYLDGPYEYNPVENEFGSCAHFNTRTPIPKRSIASVTYEKIMAEYGDTLVMVASIEERWKALAPQAPFTYLSQLAPIHFCILELIGRGRENGQITVGKTHLSNIFKDPKLLFYNRSHIQNLELVKTCSLTQVSGNKAMKTLLLRLKRFHKPVLLSSPKLGLIHDLQEYLLKQPDHCQRMEILIKQGLLTQVMAKRLNKTSNVFSFEERTLSTDSISNQQSKSKAAKLKRKFVCLDLPSDDSSQSEEETNEQPLKCQYKVKVDLMRQAYERFIDAGLKGLSQVELAQILGVGFYTARTICRTFRTKKIVREFMVDRGRQRIGRYIAVTATSDMDVKYAEERKKMLEYLFESQNYTKRQSTAADNESEHEVPRKKVKLEEQDHNNDSENIIVGCQNIENQVTEVRDIDGIENKNESFIGELFGAKKFPTLRQLRFANGTLKVLREHLAVTGFTSLGVLVSKAINEPPMDTKRFKLLIQKLVTDGQLKLYNMKWPGNKNRQINLICPPHVKITDPIIKAKYNELTTRAMSVKASKQRNTLSNANKPLSKYVYPRYMKIQKLHELIVKVVYFHDGNPTSLDMPEGFSSLVNIIPEFTVEFALGNVSNCSTSKICLDKIPDDILNVKLKNTPPDVFKMFILSPSFQRSIRTNLKVLALLGLIQLIKESYIVNHSDENQMVSYVFYVNKHAKIIDTRGTWPRSIDKLKSEKAYYFETIQDVEKYWSDVYNISIKTTIDLASRSRKMVTPPVRVQSEVLSHDNGARFGDGQGACGFDSVFYMEIPRLWCTYYIKEMNRKRIAPKKSKIKIPRKNASQKTKITKKNTKAVLARITSNVAPVMRRKRVDYAVKWTREEDKIITFCKAAITIMSPVSQPGSLRLRNFVAKDIVSKIDSKKTASLCHKRAVTLESNSNLAYEKECIINELRRREHIMEKYENLLKKLRIQNSGNMSKLMYEARLAMLELVWIISQLIKSDSYKRKVPCVALNFKDFHKNFTICSSSANKVVSQYKTPADCDIKVVAIKEGIICTVMSSYQQEKTPDVAVKIYAMFSLHSEQNLRTATEQLRKCGAISAREKLMNNLMHKLNFQDTVQSSYKVSASYARRWISRLNAEFIEKLMVTLDSELPQTDLKGSPELNCLFCELQTSGDIEMMSMTVPQVITESSGSVVNEESVDYDSKLLLKSGSLGWSTVKNIKKFAEILTNGDIKATFKPLMRSAVIETSADKKVDKENKIVRHLMNKKETGSTFQELKEITGHDTKTLTSKLTELESQNIIKRVGYYENLIILTEFHSSWTMRVEEQDFILTPWFTFDKDVRYDVFLKWAGVVLNKVFENPGCSISYLVESCEFLTARGTQDVCMVLEKWGCVMLRVMRAQEPDLFSEDDVIPVLEEFSPYESVENILVFPMANSLSKYACCMQKLLNT